MAEETTPPVLAWQAYEHEFRQRSPEWFWTVGIIAVAGALAAGILGNMLFGVLIILAAFLFAMFAVKQPDLNSFELSDKGVRVNRTFYPYRSLDSFCVTHGDPNFRTSPKLLLQSQKPFMPLLIIPFSEEVHPDAVHDYLLQYLKEEDHREPIAHHLLDLIGL